MRPTSLKFDSNVRAGIFDRYLCTMFSLYRIAMTPFQFSYRIDLLFPLEHIFWGMNFVMERDWNALILKEIRGVSGSCRFGTIIINWV